MGFLAEQLSPYGRATRAEYALSILLALIVLSLLDLVLVARQFGFSVPLEINSPVYDGAALIGCCLIWLAQARRFADLELSRLTALATAGLPGLLVLRQSYRDIAATPVSGAQHLVSLAATNPDRGRLLNEVVFNAPILILVATAILLLIPPSRSSD